VTAKYLIYSGVGFGDSPIAIKRAIMTVKRNRRGLECNELEDLGSGVRAEVTLDS
jgi:hypothetical protein